MSTVEIKNMSFKPGMALTVTGVPTPSGARFEICVGHSRENVAIVFDPRFSFGNDKQISVLNSMKNGSWQEEVRDGNFPFQQGKEFQVTIFFGNDRFFVFQHNGHVLQFPNRLADKKYDNIWIEGDVTVNSINVK